MIEVLTTVGVLAGIHVAMSIIEDRVSPLRRLTHWNIMNDSAKRLAHKITSYEEYRDSESDS